MASTPLWLEVCKGLPILTCGRGLGQESNKNSLDHTQVLDLMETILAYKLPSLSREEIRSMLHLADTDLKQTRFYREAFAEGEAEGEARGEASMVDG
jgi:predicted transposase YdaD